MTEAANNRQTDRNYTIKPTRIDIRGKTYRLNDIGDEGIGIDIREAPGDFFIGQRIEAIAIASDTETRTINGVVAHVSKHRDRLVCGIRFLFRNREEFEHVRAFKAERIQA